MAYDEELLNSYWKKRNADRRYLRERYRALDNDYTLSRVRSQVSALKRQFSKTQLREMFGPTSHADDLRDAILNYVKDDGDYDSKTIKDRA